MKLKATIREEGRVNAKSIIVEFMSNPEKQHFEVRCSFNPYQEGMRKWSGIFGIILHYLYIFLYPGHREQTYPDHRYIDHSDTHPEHLYSK